MYTHTHTHTHTHKHKQTFRHTQLVKSQIELPLASFFPQHPPWLQVTHTHTHTHTHMCLYVAMTQAANEVKHRSEAANSQTVDAFLCDASCQQLLKGKKMTVWDLVCGNLLDTTIRCSVFQISKNSSRLHFKNPPARNEGWVNGKLEGPSVNKTDKSAHIVCTLTWTWMSIFLLDQVDKSSSTLHRMI